MNNPRFRAGDVVRHGPSREKWTLACDQHRDDVQPCGWPETLAKADDCTLLLEADDETRLEQLRLSADIQRSHNGTSDFRAVIAKQQLEAEGRR
jgi:hypothetical protein